MSEQVFVRKSFGKRARSRRIALGLRQCDLANKIGTYQREVCIWERGHSLPTVESLAYLAIALHTTADWLLFGGKTPDLERGLRARDASRISERVFSGSDFSERLRTRRKALGLRQADLAEMLGMWPRPLVHWERGYHHPGAENLALLAIALAVSAEWLLFGMEHAS